MIDVALLALACTTPSETATIAVKPRPELVPVIDAAITRLLPGLTSMYLTCHAHPELSLHEEETSQRAAAGLKDAGFEVTSNVGGFGVVGVLKNGEGPVILIRGDMDALPVTEETGTEYASKVKVKGTSGADVGVMHACGHDVHVTCLVGVAHVLAALKDSWRGTVVAVAQPAEEIGVGAKAMIDDGLYKRFPVPQAAIALHVSSDEVGTLTLTPGFSFANVDSVDIVIHGIGGHGSKPQAAVDPIVIGSYVVVALQTVVSRRMDPLEPAVITVGSFHAGSKHNIIPNDATLQVTVRTYGAENRKKVLDAIRQITVETARGLGARQDPDVTIREAEFTPATYNDPNLTNAAAGLFSALLGADHVRVVKPIMGGEDFGRFSDELHIPGLMFRLGSISKERLAAYAKAGEDPPTQHSSKYYPDPEPTLKTGVRSLSSLALSLLGKP